MGIKDCFQRHTLERRAVEEGKAAPPVFAELFYFSNMTEVLDEIFQRKSLTLEF